MGWSLVVVELLYIVKTCPSAPTKSGQTWLYKKCAQERAKVSQDSGLCLLCVQTEPQRHCKVYILVQRFGVSVVKKVWPLPRVWPLWSWHLACDLHTGFLHSWLASGTFSSQSGTQESQANVSTKGVVLGVSALLKWIHCWTCGRKCKAAAETLRRVLLQLRLKMGSRPQNATWRPWTWSVTVSWFVLVSWISTWCLPKCMVLEPLRFWSWRTMYHTSLDIIIIDSE